MCMEKLEEGDNRHRNMRKAVQVRDNINSIKDLTGSE